MTFNPVWEDEATDILVKAILAVEDEDEAKRLLDDLCTIAEIKALAQRIAVARLLNENATYNSIVSLTGASTTTISRVKRCLHYGADGYQSVLKKLNEVVVSEQTSDS